MKIPFINTKSMTEFLLNTKLGLILSDLKIVKLFIASGRIVRTVLGFEFMINVELVTYIKENLVTL